MPNNWLRSLIQLLPPSARRRTPCRFVSADTLLENRNLLSAVPIGPEFQINTLTTLAQDSSSYGIYAQRYNSAGSPLSTEFRVNSFVTGSQSLPTVAMDADGDFVVTWQSYPQDGSSYGVYARRYDAAGTPATVGASKLDVV